MQGTELRTLKIVDDLEFIQIFQTIEGPSVFNLDTLYAIRSKLRCCVEKFVTSALILQQFRSGSYSWNPLFGQQTQSRVPDFLGTILPDETWVQWLMCFFFNMAVFTTWTSTGMSPRDFPLI